MLIRHYYTPAIVILICLFAASCGKEFKTISEINQLEFSDDTVFFDTIITNIGSATEVFLIKNKSNDYLKFDEVRLAGGDNSFYKVNINGVSGRLFQNLEMQPGDSMYVFVEVFIDQNSFELPFVIKDSLVFKAQDGQSDIKLIAWGQNAIFHKKEIITGNVTWTPGLPHIVLDTLHIARNSSLTIEAGTHVRFHNLGLLDVWRKAAITVNGTFENPVIFEGDRTEDRYKDVPGQWIGIRIRPKANACNFNHAIIKNGYIGLEVDSMLANGDPNVFLNSTTITTMNFYAFVGYTASVNMVNCELTNCCSYLFGTNFGGNYNLTYCTLGNFNKNCSRQDASILLSNGRFTVDDVDYPNDLNCTMVNTIIYGSQEEELAFGKDNLGSLNLTVSNCLFRTKLEFLNVNQNIINMDPEFVNTGLLNYKLDTLSPAIGKAIPINDVLIDYEGNFRDFSAPDIGAFERKE